MQKNVIKIAVAFIQFYQKFISPHVNKGMHCKFYPTCSEYAIIALNKYGFVRGCFKTAKRILRCNPFVKKHRVDFP